MCIYVVFHSSMASNKDYMRFIRSIHTIQSVPLKYFRFILKIHCFGWCLHFCLHLWTLLTSFHGRECQQAWKQTIPILLYLFIFVSFQTDYIKCLIFDLISGIYICSLSINFKDFDDLNDLFTRKSYITHKIRRIKLQRTQTILKIQVR